MSAPTPDTTASSDADALETFIGKWRARWPEWSVAEVFVPSAQRAKALAWAALQQELTDAAWAGSDPRPGEAKLAWWQEELHGWSLGRRRHPLGLALQRESAPWAQLAAALPVLRDSRERARDEVEAFARLNPLARVASSVEQALFEGASGGKGEAGSDASARLITANWLQARFAHDGEAAVPLNLLARAGEGSGADLWRDELLRDWPNGPIGTRTRRLWAALAQARLQRGDAGRPLPPWKALAVAWRAARN